ncbi:hypothetical protein GQ54DRAFT_177170 [Martensiomyces pterosporus]|nr:hypothetical protein GQ54DRAFT_177170 [Martensiomyces pterosporus]
MTVAEELSTPAELSYELQHQKHPGRVGVQRQFTWDEVKQVIAAGRLELLGRTTPKELAYREDMQKIREEHGSVVNYIQKVKLAGFLKDNSSKYLMIPNDYPYALPESTFHYIVWSKVPLTPGTVPDPEVRELFEAELDEQLGTSKREPLWFVNPPHLQSIPEVVHGHLIVKRF